MIDLPFFPQKPPSIATLPLKRYGVGLSLDRLDFGVDSIHIDVRISPQIHGPVRRAAYLSLLRHSRTEAYFEGEKREERGSATLALKNLCTEVLREGINRAKSAGEVQIDYLGQVALAKLILEIVGSEYRKLVQNLELHLRDSQLSRDFDQAEWLKTKEKLSGIKRDRSRLVRQVGEELFQVLAEVQARNLRNIRGANFPPESILADHFFTNPALHAEQAADDDMLIESYVLMGQRADEPDSYGNLRALLHGILGETDLGREAAAGQGEEAAPAEGGALDPWLREVGNIDLLFDCFATEALYKEAKRNKEPEEKRRELKSRLDLQRGLLKFVYRRFKRAGLIKPITAAYEMKSVYRSYCPPLRPLQVREYLLEPGSRKAILREMRRHKATGGEDLAPLRETIRRIRGLSGREKREHLLAFLRDFARYHRDLENSRLLRQAMDAIILITDEKILNLSKKNRLLYEFPLPDELVREESPIVGHVVIKADIRGSMDVTHTMLARGLNPAAYFSLNFFDPISEILGDYNASKVFIEGDAIILALFEQKDVPEGWYSVARACGLAVSMLQIVRRYNEQNKKHDLPVLELGIGVCYKPAAPAFLFDGDSRIMISQAINRADRLSSCDRRLRRRFRERERLFNLLVFQDAREEEIAATADDLFLRYNVNGIELDPEGFAKLSGEIHLTSLLYTAPNGEKVTLHVGKVPTQGGRYQRLIIREAVIVEIDADSGDVKGATSRKYYEVCTHPDLGEFVDSQT